MNQPKKKANFWQRLRYKYRLALMDEFDLHEKWHIRLSGLGAFNVLFLLFLFVLALFSLLIIYTPIRNVLPGYSESIRQQLIEESARVDSLSNHIYLQAQYLDVIKQITAGEVQSDTIQSLDSLQLIIRERSLEEVKSDALLQFMAAYEEQEKENLQLFDVQQNQPIVSFFRPVRGVVTTHVQPKEQQYAAVLQTTEKEPVAAVLAGTIIYIAQELDNTYTLMLQHRNYVSTYRRLGNVFKSVGQSVQSGETIAIVGEARQLEFELWKNGICINPEEVIAF